MPSWSMDRIAEHALDFWISSEDLPDPDNRVTVDAEGRIQLSYTANNQSASNHLVKRLTAMVDQLYLRNHMVERQLYIMSTMALAAVNPSLTAIANALRVAKHLRGRLGR